MKAYLTLTILIATVTFAATSQNVTINVENQPAAKVFRLLVEQTGKNFVYSSDLLKDMKVSVSASDKPLKHVLSDMFGNTDIDFHIKRKNIILKRKKRKNPIIKKQTLRNVTITPDTSATPLSTKILDEVIVLSRLESPAVETAEIGARKITVEEIRNTPVLFGETDIIKALQTQPGVSDGMGGLAGMFVHGGEADENLYMLDNVPLYHINHFGGLFSAFNTEIIRYVDFFKSSMPAKYDGRLSSFMDVRLQNGNRKGHHGSARIGLTSGSFNISGPIGKKTNYIVGLRRSWFEALTAPVMAIVNSGLDEKGLFQYYFMDANVKVTHRFSNKATGFASVYFGDDLLKAGSKDMGLGENDNIAREDDKYRFHWGNLVAQTGLNYRLTPDMTAEFTAAYTRFFSDMKHFNILRIKTGADINTTEEWIKTNNNINDWIFRGDFDWRPNEVSHVRFGANYVRHSFLPANTSSVSVVEENRTEWRDSTWSYGANEINAYIEDDWKIISKLRVNAGVHLSLFNIERKTKYGISPRLSLSFHPFEAFAFKGAYSRTTQYVHQLAQSYLSLPTDQWIPITGDFKPQTADKIAIGGYWQSSDKKYAVSAEGYYKWMRNIIDFRDEYYLGNYLEMWNARLIQGSGKAKGIDLKIEKLYGKITGHISYSLAWADRKFAEKNGGMPFPARFDNRHTVNILFNWNISNKVTLNASWTGHSGNHFTLLSQMWEAPSFGNPYFFHNDNVPLRTSINNYQLPFYHRLDLSCTVRNRRGYWTFSLYNAYNQRNAIGIKRGYRDIIESDENSVVMTSKPVFQKISSLPIIPSISYTWEF